MQESWEELRKGKDFQGQQWWRERGEKTSSPRLKKKMGIYSPFENIAIAGARGGLSSPPIIWGKYPRSIQGLVHTMS
jgi:hypothetical protein